jgi:hypothetical protein
MPIAKNKKNTRAHKSSQRLISKNASLEENEVIEPKLELKVEEIEEIKTEAKEEEEIDSDLFDDDDDESIGESILSYISYLFSYRLYQQNDIKKMKNEIRLLKKYLNLNSRKSLFWKGKICHFIKTGEENWNLNDDYFVKLGQNMNL